MQCKPVSALPSGEKWTFKIKFDGYGCVAVKRARDITPFSRHKKVLNRRFLVSSRRLLRSRADAAEGLILKPKRTSLIGVGRSCDPATCQAAYDS